MEAPVKRGGQVKQSTALTIASLLSILFTSLHFADDVARGMESGGIPNLIIVPILVVWLYGTLLLSGRRSGNAIILVASLLGAIVPVVHFKAAGGVAGGRVAGSNGAFFFVWTQIALGTTSVFSIPLALRGLWRPQARQSE
jgi:hypothetical protein